MWTKRLFIFAALLIVAGSAGAAIAAVNCGPHSRLAFTRPMPNGGTYYQCKCTDGWVPSSAATVYVRRGSVARPPPCVPPKRADRARGPTQSTRTEPQRRRGSYQAETPRQQPPKREARPANQDRKTNNVLGATSPTPKTEPVANVPPPPRPEVPVLRSSAPTWTDKIASTEKVRAAVELSEKSYTKIKDVPLPSPRSLREQAREAARENAIDSIFDKVSGGALVNNIRNMAKDMKEFEKSRADDVKEYLTHWYNLASDSAKCLASASTNTQCAQSLQDEGVLKKYGDKEAGRKDNWLKKSVGKGADVMRGNE
jgi:hypothetical protein